MSCSRIVLALESSLRFVHLNRVHTAMVVFFVVVLWPHIGLSHFSRSQELLLATSLPWLFCHGCSSPLARPLRYNVEALAHPKDQHNFDDGGLVHCQMS